MTQGHGDDDGDCDDGDYDDGVYDGDEYDADADADSLCALQPHLLQPEAATRCVRAPE